jgi:small subunit ribosomal protein S18
MARKKREQKRERRDTGKRMKKKISVLNLESIEWVDYKDVDLLNRFISDRAKIRARRVTGNSAQQQRAVARAIKIARELALIPYTQRVATSARGKRRRDRDDYDDRDDQRERRPPRDDRGERREPDRSADTAVSDVAVSDVAVSDAAVSDGQPVEVPDRPDDAPVAERVGAGSEPEAESIEPGEEE